MDCPVSSCYCLLCCFSICGEDRGRLVLFTSGILTILMASWKVIKIRTNQSTYPLLFNLNYGRKNVQLKINTAKFSIRSLMLQSFQANASLRIEPQATALSLRNNSMLYLIVFLPIANTEISKS